MTSNFYFLYKEIFGNLYMDPSTITSFCSCGDMAAEILSEARATRAFPLPVFAAAA